ncbi:MAG: hypothetical protein ACYC8V_05545 [Caulobacteraceae bacterium]
MFAWRSPPPIALRGRGRRETAPILACAVLVLAMGLQLALPHGEPLPRGSFLAPRWPRLAAIPAIPEYPVILKSPLFAPDRQGGENAATAPGAGGLDGYAVLGVATGAGLATAIIRGPYGAARAVRPGEVVEGWRLAGVERTKLIFEKAGVRHVLFVGAAPAAAGLAAGAGPGDPQ